MRTNALRPGSDGGRKRFRKEIVLVTGGGRGIGRATVLRFAEEGANVIVADRDSLAAEEVANLAHLVGVEAIPVRCDVRDETSVKSLVDSTLAKFGRISILISNAGVTHDNAIGAMTTDDWDDVMSVNARGAFLCARAVAPGMVSRRTGKIVFVSSASARGRVDQANYSVSKAGLHGLTRTLALELGPSQVNVNCVAPGHIDTAMSRAAAERLGVPIDQFLSQAAARVPLGRVGEPSDIAGVIAFLCSKDAAYVHGQIIYVDGGRPI